jgi:hypothetical protein
MLDRMHDLMMPGSVESTPGLLKEPDYRAVGSSMQKNGLIRTCPDYTDFTGRTNAGEK